MPREPETSETRSGTTGKLKGCMGCCMCMPRSVCLCRSCGSQARKSVCGCQTSSWSPLDSKSAPSRTLLSPQCSASPMSLDASHSATLNTSNRLPSPSFLPTAPNLPVSRPASLLSLSHVPLSPRCPASPTAPCVALLHASFMLDHLHSPWLAPSSSPPQFLSPLPLYRAGRFPHNPKHPFTLPTLNAVVLPAPVALHHIQQPLGAPAPNSLLRDPTASTLCPGYLNITQGPSGIDCRHSDHLVHLGLRPLGPTAQITLSLSICTPTTSAPQSMCPS
jgi:hypothetical protein